MAVTRNIKERVREHGARYLNDRELLESLIEVSAAKSHEIITAVGSLANLAQAAPDELMHYYRLTERQSRVLASALELKRRGVPSAGDAAISCPADAAHRLFPRLSHRLQEEMHVLLLNTRNHVIAARTIYIGTINQANLRNAELLRPAILLNAPAFIIAHNHPSGDTRPSPEDIAVTRSLVAAGQLMDIQLLDHLIIGNEQDFTSLKEQELGFD